MTKRSAVFLLVALTAVSAIGCETTGERRSRKCRTYECRVKEYDARVIANRERAVAHEERVVAYKERVVEYEERVAAYEERAEAAKAAREEVQETLRNLELENERLRAQLRECKEGSTGANATN